MIAKLLLQNSLYVVAMGALLFASAGTLHWPGAWVFLVTSAMLGPACGLWLAQFDPALLAERHAVAGAEGSAGRGQEIHAGVRPHRTCLVRRDGA